MKILNLYAGIGGNRKFWNDVKDDIEVTAVEFDKAIARAYKDRYPNDKVIVADAKEYLLKHYRDFDFIWVSPPCQTHSRIINSKYKRESYRAKFPDMSLYEIILFLTGHTRDKLWVVENVKPYYKPLLEPTAEIDRHLYWSNFNITKIYVEKMYIQKYVTCASLKDFDLKKYKDIKNKRQVIRNQVNYDIGKHILECAIGGSK